MVKQNGQRKEKSPEGVRLHQPWEESVSKYQKQLIIPDATGSNRVGRNTIQPPSTPPNPPPKKNRKGETILDNVQFQGLIHSVNS